MEAKTQTTIGELNTGDRFYFMSDSQRKAYQLITKDKKTALYNCINENGNRQWQYDKEAKSGRLVVFLRHT